MNNPPKVFVVIVTFNGEPWLQTCLDSLENQMDSLHVIVVDNASTDDSCQFILDAYPAVRLIRQPHNLGFGRANNVGISYALKEGADFVFLLNQDAFLKPDCIERLVKVSEAYPDYGILSPIHLTWNGRELEHYFSRFALKNTQFYSDFILNSPLQPIYEVPFVNAAGWLLPKQTLESVGGFDPMFYHYGEDNNYCQRVLYHGFKIGIVPESFLCHDGVIRKKARHTLFSETYFRDEVKQLQIHLGDLNKSVGAKDYLQVRQHVIKLVVLSFWQLNFKKVLGFLKKYRYYDKAFADIKRSRETNIVKQPHYLEF